MTYYIAPFARLSSCLASRARHYCGVARPYVRLAVAAAITVTCLSLAALIFGLAYGARRSYALGKALGMWWYGQGGQQFRCFIRGVYRRAIARLEYTGARIEEELGFAEGDTAVSKVRWIFVANVKLFIADAQRRILTIYSEVDAEAQRWISSTVQLGSEEF